MRFYTKQHQFYCGIDLHARTIYLCVVNKESADKRYGTAGTKIGNAHLKWAFSEAAVVPP